MPTTIDQLQIEVETKSEKAEQGLRKLQATLQKLNKIAQSSGLDVTCKQLEKIASINFSNLSPLSKIAQVTKPLQDVSDKIQNITDSVVKMPSDFGMSMDIGGIEDTVSEIQSTVHAINDVPKEIITSVQAQGTSEAVAKLDAVQNALVSIPEAKNLTIQLQGAVNATNEIEAVVLSVEELPFEVITSVEAQGMGETVANLKTVIDSANQVPKEIKVNISNGQPTSTDAFKISDDFIQAQNEISVLKTELDSVKIKLEEALNFHSADSDAITKLTAQVKDLQAELDKAGASTKRLASNMKSVGTASSALKKATKGISQLLKIVIVYGGAFRAVQMATRGVSEGLNNIAKYNDETAASMSKLSTMSLYLKNSIGAALYPVIVAITPALQSMTNAIVRALNAFNQFVAALRGETVFLKAKEYVQEYGDEAKKTADKIKRSFAGMDEITVIGQQDSGVGSNLPDYSQMFEEAPISEKTFSVVENLKDHLSEIVAIVGGIGAGFLAWKLSKGLMDGLKFIKSLRSENFSFGFSILGVGAFISDLAYLNHYVDDIQQNGASFYNVSGIIGEFAGAIGDACAALGNAKLGALFNFIQGAAGIVGAVKDIAENGANFENVTRGIRGISDILFAVGLLTKNKKLSSVSITLQGLTGIIGEVGENWEAIRQGDWSGVDKGVLFASAVEMLFGIIGMVKAFSKSSKSLKVAETASELKKVTDVTDQINTTTSSVTSKLTDLAKNLALGLVIIVEVAAAAILVVGSVWVLGKELEQVGLAWQPVIDNGATVAIAIGLGVSVLVGVGAVTALLGSVGTPLIANIALGTLMLAELGIATGLFILEIWGIGKGLDAIGQAWQPVLDNGATIATAIGVGTGLLVGIGVVTAALGAATVASAGALPLAIGLGTALLVELGAAFVLFVDSLVAVADQLSGRLHPSLTNLNAKLPELSSDMSSFTSFMQTFAGQVVDYSKSSAIAGFSSTVDAVLRVFTKDPIQSLANDADKQYRQSTELNKKLRVANPELETAIWLMQQYYSFLEKIEGLTKKSNNISLASGMFVSMKEVGKNLVTGFVAGISSENSSLSKSVKSVLGDTFSNKEARSYGYDFGKNLGKSVADGFKSARFPTLSGTIDVSGGNFVSLKLKAYAKGGFPDEEDGLFFANHNELVGKFSNGKTAVANNDQIVSGIQNGVYAANQEQNALLREQNRLLRQLLEKDSTVRAVVSTSDIEQGLSRKNRRNGVKTVPVG